MPSGYSNNSISVNDVAGGILRSAYDQLDDRLWDCLGVWVIVDPPAKFPYAHGDVVLRDDVGWRLCHDGEINSVALDNQPIDGGMIQNASWARRVSQWKVYNDATKNIVTLIDRSK